jgi:60 kDa SS-A/Ro ribonucleoprotein
MVNKNLFPVTDGKVKTTRKTTRVEPANTTNMAGGKAYKSTTKHALAQIACTGTFNGTYYATGSKIAELAKQQIKELIKEGDVEFLAKLAVYSHTSSYMKDLPAYLLVELYLIDTQLFKRIFNKVVTNGKMLRNVVQIARSGALGKKINLSNKTWRTVIQSWFDSRTGEALFKANIGNDPALADIIKMARVKPTEANDDIFKYILGKEYNLEGLPDVIRNYELYKKGLTKELPEVDFRYLDSLPLTTSDWTKIALNANFHTLRMNLNTFDRHGVLKDSEVVNKLADKLRDKKSVLGSKVFPYQLMMTYLNAEVCSELNMAVQDAMEIATENVTTFQGKMAICVDVSGSMNWSSLTGNRGTATSKAKPVHAAALFASVYLRNNKNAVVMPFDTRVHSVKINPRDSVVTNTQKLCINGGGTDCSVALRELNNQNAMLDTIVVVSDNESWVQFYFGNGTSMMNEWVKFKRRNPNAKLILIDLTPSVDSQVTNHTDILMVGGWSDEVFNVVNSFLSSDSMDHWVEKIESVEI